MSPKTKKQLELQLAHDYCASKKPVLTAVFVHGIASDSSTFDKAFSHLEVDEGLKDVRFAAFDLLGSGKSMKDDSLEYDYEEQITALHNSIDKLGVETPIILVGHSMGTLIVTRYASIYPDNIFKLVLISPPVYTVEDLESSSFQAGMKVFREAVSVRNRKILEEKSFENSMDKIVSDKKNYHVLESTKIPTVLIYGKKDRFIGAHNIPRLLKNNPKFLSAFKTDSLHGVSSDKYNKLGEILKETLDTLNNDSEEKK